MVEPTGYTALDLIGFTDKGPYDPTANYVRNDLVHVGNSTWRCKIDDTTGITPTEGANWTIFIESATSLAGMSDVDLNTPKAGDGLVHDGNDWTNIPIMTKEQWQKNGAYNLCPINRTTTTQDGTLFTVNANKTITATVPANPTTTTFYLFGSNALARITLPAGTYKLVGCPSGGSTSTYYIQGFGNHDYTSGAGILETGSGVEFTLTQENDLYFYISIRNTFTSGGTVLFKPMITTDRNATYDDYVEYAKTNRELTEDIKPVYFDVNNIASNNGTVDIGVMKCGSIYQLKITINNANSWATGSGDRITFTLPSSIPAPTMNSAGIGLNVVTAQVGSNRSVLLQNNSGGSISANNGQSVSVTYIAK